MFAEIIGIGYGLAAEQSLRAAFAQAKKELSAVGITADRQTVLPPDRTELHRALADALSRTDVVVTVGGLGIGPKDITLSTVSGAVGIPLVLNQQALEAMRERRDVSGETPAAAERRATLPSGCDAFPNPRGQMCGCAISAGAQCIAMLPAELPELVPMLIYHAGPYLAKFTGTSVSIRTIRLYGMTASQAEEILGERLSARNPVISVFEDCGETAVQVTAHAVTREQAENTALATVKTLLPKFENVAYGVDVENIQQALVQELYAHDMKASVAEEGTGGALLDRLSGAHGAYGAAAGIRQDFSELGISEKKLKKYGRHSQWAAAAAAAAAMERDGAQIGAAITMDAGGVDNEAVIAVTDGKSVWLRLIKPEDGGRAEAREQAALTAMHLIRAVVRDPASAGALQLSAVLSGKKKLPSEKKQKRGGESGENEGRPRKKGLKIAVLILCALVFLGSIGYIASVYYESYKNRENTASLLELLEQSRDGAHPLPVGYPEGWLKEFAAWYEINPDIIGHVYIDGTGLNYPVVQTSEPGATGLAGQWYLRRDFYKQDNQHGIPFLDYRSSVEPGAESVNMTIYGHNMRDGQMFGELMSYKTLAYYKEHPTIHFDSVYAESEWKIIAVIITNAYERDGPVWNYHNFINDGDNVSTDNFLNAAASRTLIVTGVDYNAQDRFVTLSTCSYEFTDARFVLIARQVREGESAQVDTSAAYYNPSPLMPDEWYQAIAQAQGQEAASQQSQQQASNISAPGSSAESSQESGTSSQVPVEAEPEPSASESAPPSSSSASSSVSSSVSSSASSSVSSAASSSVSGSASSSASSSTSSSSSGASESQASSSESVSEPASSVSEPPSSEPASSAARVPVTETSSGDRNRIPVPETSRASSSSQASSSSSTSSSSASSSSSSSSSPSSSQVREDSGTAPSSGSYYEESLENTFIINGKVMSEYEAVCQIVAAEMGTGTTQAEALKAQAVAAYSYIKCNGGRTSAALNTPSELQRKVIREVIGQALYDNESNKYVNAVYSAESCGVTAASQWMWGGYNRNLQSVPSPVDATSSKTYTISASDFRDKVSSGLRIELSGDPEDWITIASYWEDTDYINAIYLGDTKTTARKLRENCLGSTSLRSTAFTVSYNSSTDSFTFTTWGYGHGVGLSQLGAIAYAKNGWSYDEILLHYYSNCYIN